MSDRAVRGKDSLAHWWATVLVRGLMIFLTSARSNLRPQLVWPIPYFLIDPEWKESTRSRSAVISANSMILLSWVRSGWVADHAAGLWAPSLNWIKQLPWCKLNWENKLLNEIDALMKLMEWETNITRNIDLGLQHHWQEKPKIGIEKEQRTG